MTKTKVPQLRFSGFSGEWKEDSLGNYSHIIGGGTPSTSNDKYWNGTINWFSPIEIGENKYVSNSAKKISDIGLKKSSAKILPKGSLLFTSRAGIGKTAILLKESCTNQGFQSIVPADGKLDIEFLYAISYKLKNYGNKMGSGSTFIEVSGKTMSKMKLKLPNFNEQKKIGDFFEKQDKLIELQTQKVNQLKKLKRGYLQKMFPQAGETVPRLRFSGFSGEWTQKLLLDSGLVYGGLTGKTKEDFGHGSSKYVPYMSVNRNFVSNDNDVELVNVLESEKQHAVKKNDVLFTISSETPEEVGLSSTWLGNEETYLNSFSFGYRFNFPTDGYFTSALFRSSDVRNKIYPLAQGISRYNLSKHSFLDLKLRFPKFDEQKKIGVFFEKLDQIIGEQTDKIEILKQQKKAYLQKMFI